MKCVKCGAEMPDNGKFCLECGTKLEVEEPVKRIVLKCSICNGQLESEEGKQNLICPYCGSRELILDSDSVAIQRIKSEAFKDVELARMKNETDKEKRREEKEMREAYKKSKFAKFTGICFFIAVGLTIFGFSTNHILSAMTALIMAALFATSWLMGMQIIPEKIKYLHVILAVAGIGMILLFIFGTGSCSPKKLEKINWPTSGLASEVPTPNMKYGSIGYNTEDMFSADMDEADKDDFVEYVDMCKEAGFVIDENVSDNSFAAYDEEGVKVDIYYNKIADSVDIHVYASVSNKEYIWPNSKIANMLPKPKSTYGSIENESSDSLHIKVAKTTKNDYENYVSECEKRGFNNDYKKHDNYFNADNTDGYSLSLRMEENNTMDISIHKKEETIDTSALEPNEDANDITDSSQKETEQENDGTEEKIEEVETNVEEDEPAVNENKTDANGVSIELKEFLDNYEAFMDEYVAFMKKYATDSNNIFSMAKDYLEIVDKLSDFEKAASKYDKNSMSEADAKYFTEAMLRIDKKMIEGLM